MQRDRLEEEEEGACLESSMVWYISYKRGATRCHSLRGRAVTQANNRVPLPDPLALPAQLHFSFLRSDPRCRGLLGRAGTKASLPSPQVGGA